MLKETLLLVCFATTASALTCYTCDQDTCQTTPRVEGCDPSTKCYTVSTPTGGVVLRKGCTRDCAYEASGASGLLCNVCDGDQCNDQAGNPPPPSDNKGTPQPGIGGGAVPTTKHSTLKFSLFSTILSIFAVIFVL